MKNQGAAVALATLFSRDPRAMEASFCHMTEESLAFLDRRVTEQQQRQGKKGTKNGIINGTLEDDPEMIASRHHVIAKSMIRRIVYRQLEKYASICSADEVEEALKHYKLPQGLREDLAAKYGEERPCASWWDSLQQLRSIAGDDTALLWQLVLEHPMTAYVPMQCQACGHVVPDDAGASEASDNILGLSEIDPQTVDPESLLELRGGWFRGRPRGAKILRLDCPECGAITDWYRSGHPRIILNPNRWGRLCGEQEDLRLALANYLGIPIRTCIPLDWDHVWSEYGLSQKGSGMEWCVQDDSARNFAVRLDEGIGAWTGVLAIHPDPSLCEDATQEYLDCRPTPGTDRGSPSCITGRADPCHAPEMPRHRHTVKNARSDRTGGITQAKTLVGFLLERAGMTHDDVTNEMRLAAEEYRQPANKRREWWQLND